MSERTNVTPLTAEERGQVSGGLCKKNGVTPGYKAPTVLYDDGINVQTTDASTANVVTQVL